MDERPRAATRRHAFGARATGGERPVEPLERRTLFSSGDLDPTFGDGGKVTIDAGGSASDEIIRDVAVQSDGKIIEVARHGGFGVTVPVLAVTRFDRFGRPDPTFGDNGVRTIEVPGRGVFFSSLAVGADDRIVVAGWATNPQTDILATDSDVYVAVLNPDGSPDTSFDGDGLRVFDFGQAAGGPSAARTTDFVFGVGVQSDGKVLTAGSINLNGQGRFAVSRLNRDGTLDATFDGDGVVTAPFGSYSSAAYSVAPDASGRILVSGNAGTLSGTPPRFSNAEFAVARYNPDGSLDATFDGDGWAITGFSANEDTAYRVRPAPGGRIVAAGVTNGTTQDLAVARYNADGSPDTTFSGDGKATFGITRPNSSGALAPSNESALGMAVQPDGAIVMSGRSSFGGFSNTLPQTVLVRLTADGSPDTAFGPQGTGSLVVPELDEGWALALQSDGYILAGGSVFSTATGYGDFAVARFDPYGYPDTGFGDSGLALADFPDAGFDTATSAAMQPDGKLVIAGFTRPRTGSASELLLVRLNTDGTLDPTFDGDGILRIDLGAGETVDPLERINAVTVDAEGRIVFAGVVSDSSTDSDDVLVGRVNADGSTDWGFGGSGVLRIGNLGGLSAADEFTNDVLVQPDGRIVLVGEQRTSNTARTMFALRLEADGTFDWSFGPDFNAAVRVPVGTAGDSAAEAVALAPDQDGDGFDLVLAGSALVSGADQFALVRLNPDGSLDNAFGTAGKATAFVTNASRANANDVVVDSLGRVLAAGSARFGSGVRDDFALMRFTPAGALDPAFDADGRVTTNFDGENDVANSVVILPDGSILAGGTTSSNFGLARYTANGTLDESFATAGRARTDFEPGFFPGAPSSSRDSGLQVFAYGPDKAVLAGAGYPARTSMDFAAARYLLTGPPNQPPVANPGTTHTMPEGAAAGLTLSANATDADGRVVKYEWDVNYDTFSGFTPDSVGPEVTVPPLADEDLGATRRVAVRVTDDDGATHLVIATVTTTNVTPTVSAGPDATIAPGGTFTRTGSFTDPGADSPWTATVNYGTGGGFVNLPLNPDKTFTLNHTYANAGTYTVTVRVRDKDFATGEDTIVVTVGAEPNTVTGRQIFYNNSRHGPAPASVATDKQALLPGQTPTFGNVTSYSRGINGLLVTFRGDVAALDAGDFEFHVSAGPNLPAWEPAPAPSGITVTPGPALGTSVARLTWPDGAIRNQWLRVTVKPTARTGLAAADVFYVGNLVGETGNNAGATLFVSAADLAAVRSRLLQRARPVTDPFDIDRDGIITAVDVLHVRRNYARTLALAAAPAAAPPPATFSDAAVSGVTDEVLGAG